MIPPNRRERVILSGKRQNSKEIQTGSNRCRSFLRRDSEMVPLMQMSRRICSVTRYFSCSLDQIRRTVLHLRVGRENVVSLRDVP